MHATEEGTSKKSNWNFNLITSELCVNSTVEILGFHRWWFHY